MIRNPHDENLMNGNLKEYQLESLLERGIWSKDRWNFLGEIRWKKNS